jgi:hypothetical protein
MRLEKPARLAPCRTHVFYRGKPLCRHIDRHASKKFKEIKTGLSAEESYRFICGISSYCFGCMKIMQNFMK